MIGPILFVTPNESAGGAEHHLISLAKQLQNSFACEVHVAVLLPESEASKEKLGLSHLHYIGKFSRKYSSAVRACCSFLALRKLIVELEPTHIYSCLDWSNILAGLSCLSSDSHWIAGLQNPLIARHLQPSGLVKSLRFKLHDCLLRHAQAVVVPSTGFAEDLQKLKILKEKIITIPNVVEFAEAKKSDCKLSPKDAELQLGFCARLVTQKNPFAVLRLVERLSQSRCVKLHIVGEGALEDELRQYCQQRGISDNVEFYGFLKNPWSILHSVDLLLSTSHFEGFGNVLVEALNHRVPVVAYDAPFGPRDIILHAETGYLVPVGDELALEQTVISLAQSRDTRERLARATERHASRFFVDRIAALFFNKVFQAKGAKLH